MKQLRFIYVALFLLVIIACEEDANFPETRLGIIPTVVPNPSKQTFDLNDEANTAVEFTLDYNNFGGELIADTIFITVATTNITAPNPTTLTAGPVALKYVTEFPSTVTLSLVELCAALGLDPTAVTNTRSFEILLTLKTEDGTIFQEGTNIHPSVSASNTLGYYRYRFLGGCQTGVEEGYYAATTSGTNRLGITSQNEVRIATQTIVVEGNNSYLNFMRDIFTITDITAGFYPTTTLNPALIKNQPVGIRDVCGNFSLFNTALLTLPSPNPQVTFTSVTGSWDASTKTLTLNWTDATNTITETTTFVKVRDL